MQRRTFVLSASAFAAMRVSSTSARHARQEQAASRLPKGALAVAQRMFWIESQEYAANENPAWNCVAIFFSETEAARASYNTLLQGYTSNLTIAGETPAVSTPVDQDNENRHLFLLQLDSPLSYDVFIAQRGRLIVAWAVFLAADVLTRLDHGVAMRHAADEVLERVDDQPFYGREELFALLPEVDDLPDTLELEHSPEEDFYEQDY